MRKAKRPIMEDRYIGLGIQRRYVQSYLTIFLLRFNLILFKLQLVLFNKYVLLLLKSKKYLP